MSSSIWLINAYVFGGALTFTNVPGELSVSAIFRTVLRRKLSMEDSAMAAIFTSSGVEEGLRLHSRSTDAY